MLTVNFVAQHLSLQGLMLNVAILVGKNTFKSTAVETIQNYAANKVIGAYVKDYLLDMAVNAHVAEKQNLNFWRLTMSTAVEDKKGKLCQLNR